MNSTKRILVIDDNRQLQDTMKFVLDMEGYQTFSAGDGAQALNLIRDYPPDLIFLDMFMPGMDGWAFLEEYYRKPGRRAPIVGMSGDILDPDLLPGVESFLRKPYSAEQLLSLVQSHTERQ